MPKMRVYSFPACCHAEKNQDDRRPSKVNSVECRKAGESDGIAWQHPQARFHRRSWPKVKSRFTAS